ncbi:hypothetical protein H6F77_08510 [Microcoleus sp. FACHB-831]|uniref:hypothetical protein n=1 Tax=Microcoleus sp. FACHB-831 TaxID=2692827 RepID=UPI0016860769|nr:hypothetical protein [Microcoleus sp. FACHB-831]MBD1921132.1 hypothetical protein [Microcoleus sp. FACHB-831]
MALDLDLFSNSNFRNTIQRYCNQLGWGINDINARRAILKFTANSGNTQTLFIIRYENTLEFSVPSGIKFNSAEDVPGWMSNMLLCKNTEYKIGFWCIEDLDSRKIFSVMHNAEISLINVEYFGKVVLKLVNECDEFEQLVAKALRGY